MFRCVFIGLLLICNSSLAQKGRVLAKTNILFPFSLSLECQLAEKGSLQIGGGFLPESVILKGLTVKNFVIEYKYYYRATEEEPARVYFGPYLGVTNVFYEKPSGARSFLDSHSFGVNTGYLFPFENNMIVEVFLGVGYKFYQSHSGSLYSFGRFEKNAEIRAGIVIGFKLFGPSVVPEKL